MVLSLSARGLTHGDISAHLAEVYGAEVSKTTISTITDRVIEGMTEWQNRPLDPLDPLDPVDPVYPVIFIDCIHVKVRDGQVANRPIYVALAVTVEGNRDILGLWAGDGGEGGEGAKYWLQVRTEIKNRGVEDVCMDVCMVVCDGLKGPPRFDRDSFDRDSVAGSDHPNLCGAPDPGQFPVRGPARTGTRSPQH